MTTWVLLRGLTRESRHWGAFVPRFRTLLPDAEVIALDLPGNGRLHAAASPTRVDAMAAHCRAELQSRGVAPPYCVLGLSLGAMVAIDWASRHPEELQACVLINTSLAPIAPWYWRLRPASVPALLKLALARGSARDREGIVLRLTSRHAPAPQLLDEWAAYRNEHPVTLRNALRQLVAAARFRAPPIAPAVPTLVLASRGDALVDMRCSQRLATLWHATLDVHPSAGHDIALDDADWVALRVRDWLARNAVPA